MEFRQLLPEPALRTAEEVLASVEPLRAVAGRPYVAVNFVTSLDGRAGFQGRSGQLGDEGDRALFHGLRERAGAVMAGTGTLRVERYGRMMGSAERRARRTTRGLSPEPLACIVTRSGMVPLDIPLFSEPEAKVALFSGAEIALDEVAAQVKLVQLSAQNWTLAAVLERLATDFQVSWLLCEGGPSLFSGLLAEGLVDELFLTLAPKLTGGGASPSVTAGGELPELAALQLVWVLEREGSLFLRYAMR